MTDEQLAEIAAKAKELDARSKKLAAQAKKHKDRVRAEMERRGTKGIVTHGLKITWVQAETVVYNESKLLRSLGADVFETLTRRVFDKDLLAAAVQEGRVPMAKAERASEIQKNAPYVLINPAGDDDE